MEVKTDLLNAAVFELLKTATNRPGALGEIPDLTAEDPTPYWILYPLTIPRGIGSWNNPEEEHDHLYQVTCVGGNHAQTAWMSDKVHDALVERGPYEGWAWELVVDGLYVTGRSLDVRGGILPSGKNLLETADTYRIRAGE